MDFSNVIIPYITLEPYKISVKPINFDDKIIKGKDLNFYQSESQIDFKFRIEVNKHDNNLITSVTNSEKAINYVLIIKSNSSIFRKSFILEKDTISNLFYKEINISKNDFRDKIEMQSLIVRKNSISKTKNLMAFEQGAVLSHSDTYNIFIDEPDFNKNGDTPTEWKSFSEDKFLQSSFKDNWFWCDFKKSKPIVYLNSDLNETVKDIIKSNAFGASKKAKIRDAYHHQIANVFLNKLLMIAIYKLKDSTENHTSFPQIDELNSWEFEIVKLFAPIVMEEKDEENAISIFLEKIHKDDIKFLLKKIDISVSKHLKSSFKMNNLPDLLSNKENDSDKVEGNDE